MSAITVGLLIFGLVALPFIVIIACVTYRGAVEVLRGDDD